MLRTQIQLTEEQSQELKRLAAERHTSVAELIREAAENFLRESATLDKTERRKRALAAAGRFRSGVRDLSAQHDEHLARAFNE